MKKVRNLAIMIVMAGLVGGCEDDLYGRPDYNRKADKVHPINTGEGFGRDGIEIRITGLGYSEGYPFLEVSTTNNSGREIQEAHFYARAMRDNTVIDTGMVNVSSTGTLYPGETSLDKAYFYDIHRHEDYQFLDIRGIEWQNARRINRSY